MVLRKLLPDGGESWVAQANVLGCRQFHQPGHRGSGESHAIDRGHVHHADAAARCTLSTLYCTVAVLCTLSVLPRQMTPQCAHIIMTVYSYGGCSSSASGSKVKVLRLAEQLDFQ